MDNANPPQIEQMIGRNVGGCEILELVGQGAMGDVYRAHQVSLKRTVALKILARELSRRQDLIQRFRREAHAVARLSHQNIANVYDFGECDGLYYLVMEFVDGQSLEETAQEADRLDPEVALDYIMQAAAGLAHAQKVGILHRDIKPGNLLASNDGVIKVADFGLAKTEYDTTTGDITAIGTMMGTPNYMSPEQCAGGQVTAATDVYCLGGTFYRVITGQTCFPAENAVAVMLKHQSEDPVPPFLLRPELPTGYSEIIMKMLSKKPEDRYADAGEALEDLANLKEGRPVKATQFCYWPPAINPGYQDDRHFLRGVQQWKLCPQEQIGEALRIQQQIREIGRDELLYEVMLGKEWISREKCDELWDAIHRTRRQKVDQAFIAAAEERGVVPLERSNWLQRKLKESESEGRPKPACHILMEREYIYPDEVRNALLAWLEKERTREEAAFRDAAARLALVDPEELDALFDQQRAELPASRYRRPEQLVVEKGLLTREATYQVFHARLVAELGDQHQNGASPRAGAEKKAAKPPVTPARPLPPQEDAPIAHPEKRSKSILPSFDKLKMVTGVFCHFCRKEIPRASVFCPFCKHQLPLGGAKKPVKTIPREAMRTPPPVPLPPKAVLEAQLKARARKQPEPPRKKPGPDLWVAKLPAGELTRPLTLEMVAKLIVAKKIGLTTPVQAPYAEGKWLLAGAIKELARFFGQCHACGKTVMPNDRNCPHCHASF